MTTTHERTTMTSSTPKRAIDLQKGDVCVGPSVDFSERGVVKSTVIIDRGVQINWQGGTHTVRPEDYLLDVQEDTR